MDGKFGGGNVRFAKYAFNIFACGLNLRLNPIIILES